MEMHVIVMMFVLITMLGTKGIFLLSRSVNGMMDQTTFFESYKCTVERYSINALKLTFNLRIGKCSTRFI
jgi:hypothetical protein